MQWEDVTPPNHPGQYRRDPAAQTALRVLHMLAWLADAPVYVERRAGPGCSMTLSVHPDGTRYVSAW